MKNMRIPMRPAPSIEEARQKTNNDRGRFMFTVTQEKKKPPPRPPPPNFAKAKSKSAWNLNQTENTISLIEWSPPASPKPASHPFCGSVSSSFSSSTSSLASSKKSLEYDTVPINNNPWNNNSPFPFATYGLQASNVQQQNNAKTVPTIIRPQPAKKPRRYQDLSREVSPNLNGSRGESPANSSRGISPYLEPSSLRSSPPMPNVPPPSPPKIIEERIEPFGIALYDYPATQTDDLELHVNDIVYLIKKINDEWLQGRVDDREGMFPVNFIEIQVPLSENCEFSMSLYEFQPQMPQDLALKPGQKVKVINRISNDWLFGESDGLRGQFPANFVDRIPPNI